MINVSIENANQFNVFNSALERNLKLKMGYNYSMNEMIHSKFPYWLLGQLSRTLFYQKDLEGMVYECLLQYTLHCREFELGKFKIYKTGKVLYGIGNNHPDNIEFDTNEIEYYKDSLQLATMHENTIEEQIKLIDFGIDKAIEKANKELEEWKIKEWKKTPEYLLKE